MVRWSVCLTSLVMIALPGPAFADSKADCTKGVAMIKAELAKKHPAAVRVNGPDHMGFGPVARVPRGCLMKALIFRYADTAGSGRASRGRGGGGAGEPAAGQALRLPHPAAGRDGGGHPAAKSA